MRCNLTNEEPGKINQELLDAAEKGNTELCETLLEQGANPNIADGSQSTALHYAVKNGNFALFGTLMEKGADPNIIDSKKNTAFHYAAKNNDTAMCLKLLETIDDVNLQGCDGMTALHYAAKNGDFVLFRALMKKGADSNIRDRWEDLALHHAADNDHWKKYSHYTGDIGHTLICLKLLETIDDVNVRGCDGMIPLHHVVKRNNSKLFEALIKKGADPKIKDDSGKNSLHYAAAKNHTDICLKLLDTIDDIDLQSKNGMTPLHDAARCGNLEIFNALMKKGANPNIIDGDKKTALHYAARIANRDICLKLLETIDDVNLQDRDGMTPLHHVAMYGNSELFDAFIKKGANSNITDRWGMTALLWVSKWDNRDICFFKLVETIDDINAQDDGGKTPLYYAVDRENAELVRFLISEGANISDDLSNSISNDIRIEASYLYQAKLAKERSLIDDIAQEVQKNLTNKTIAILGGYNSLSNIFITIKEEIRGKYFDAMQIDNLFQILSSYLDNIANNNLFVTGKFKFDFRKYLVDFTEWSINLKMSYMIGRHLDNFKEDKVKLETARPRDFLANIFVAIKEEIGGGYCDVGKIKSLYKILTSHLQDIESNKLLVTGKFKFDFRKYMVDFTEWSINLRMSYMIGRHLDDFLRGNAVIPGDVMGHVSSFLSLSDTKSLEQVFPGSGYQKNTGELRRYGRDLLWGIEQGTVRVSYKFLHKVIIPIGERKYYFREEFFAGFEGVEKSLLAIFAVVSDYVAEYRETISDRDERSKQNDHLGNVCRIKLMKMRQIMKEYYNLAIEDDYNMEPDEALRMVDGFGREFIQQRNARQEDRQDLSEPEVLYEVAQDMLSSVVLIGKTIPRAKRLVELVEEKEKDGSINRIIDNIKQKSSSSIESLDL